MTMPSAERNSGYSPLLAMAMGKISGVLAMVIRTDGPSYRAVGASMVFHDDGSKTGSLSSGCIEADLAIHAAEVRKFETPIRIIYGRGSPFVDIQLPCGGGLEILLLPQLQNDERLLVSQVVTKRKTLNIAISLDTGRITKSTTAKSGLNDDQFALRLIPPLRFVVFGKGPEATTFTRLVQSLGYNGAIVSPDPETLKMCQILGWSTHEIRQPIAPGYIDLDERSAITFFFHDHEWEAPILKDVLGFDTFYIGCQGSKRTSDNRMIELERLGVSAQDRQRVRGPIGLVPSVRDSNTLAVSVLAEILSFE